MSDDPLQTPVQFLKGVGPQRAELLYKLGLKTAADVLYNLPRDYLDLTVVKAVADLQEGKLQTVRGKVVDLDAKDLSRNRTLSAVLLDCDGDYVRGVWFNQHWVLRKFRPGDLVLFSGKVKRAAGRWEMSHPTTVTISEEDAQAGGGILPIYSLTDGLKMEAMRRIARHTSRNMPRLYPKSYRRNFANTQICPESLLLCKVFIFRKVKKNSTQPGGGWYFKTCWNFNWDWH